MDAAAAFEQTFFTRKIHLLGDALLNIGKIIIFFGVVLVAIGVVFLIAGRMHLPFGHLPGDIAYRRKNFSFYFPLTTSILISIVLSLLFYLFSRMHR